MMDIKWFAQIGPNVSIGGGVTIGPGVKLRDTIILDGASVGSHTLVANSIVGKLGVDPYIYFVQNVGVVTPLLSGQTEVGGSQLLLGRVLTSSLKSLVPSPHEFGG